jgi:3',5'-cyclic AMP phosphodiesterase CpdA
MFRIIQISDTHISPAKAHFAGNWSPLAEWIAAQRPDLVIHTGDVTVDGADSDADLGHCAGLLAELGVPFRAVPGNHDVGDSNHHHQPVNRERVSRWNRHFGADRWVFDVEGWRLIGLDAMLIGSFQPEEAAQLAWLDGVMAQAKDRRFGWFLHRPLFIEDPDEGDTGYWSIKPEPRRVLLELVRRYGVALVASGHLHKAHDFSRDGTRYVWGPSAGFLGGPQIIPPMPGETRLGAVRYEFDGDRLDAAILEVPGLTEYWIEDVVDEVYPAHADTQPRNAR